MHHMGPESFPKHFPSELHTNLANFLLAVYHQNVSQFLPSLPAPNYTRFLHTPYSSMSPSKRLPLLAHSIFYWKFYCLTSSRIYVFFLYPCSPAITLQHILTVLPFGKSTWYTKTPFQLLCHSFVSPLIPQIFIKYLLKVRDLAEPRK